VRIIGIDPGGTTGWAVWDGEFKECGQLGPEPHHLELSSTLERVCGPDSIIVCEHFKKHDLTPSELISLEYIGVVRLFAEIYNIRLVMQYRSQKEWATNDRLQKLGIVHNAWIKERNAVDAQRHIVVYIISNVYVPMEIRTALLARLRPKETISEP
jgi:hypothetical protein